MVTQDVLALRAACRLAPTDPTNRLVLADALTDSGDDEGADLQRRIAFALSMRPVAHGKSFKFFKEWAGYVVGELAAGALALARAERVAQELGFEFEWEEDPEPYEMGDAETEMPSEVLNCLALYADDERDYTSASLCGIGDPSPEYHRVVEAELALEILAQI